MHFKKDDIPRFQIRLLEYEKDGMTFKKSKNRNIYPNKNNLTIEEIWNRIEKVIENKPKTRFLKKDTQNKKGNKRNGN